MQAIRLNSVQPTMDGRRWKIKASWHNDDWFVDAYDQNPTPWYNNPILHPGGRLPYPWRPFRNPHAAGDPLYPKQFTISTGISIRALASGGSEPVLSVYGHIPINILSKQVGAPWVPYQAQISGGGDVPAGTWYVTICAQDSNGLLSAVSPLVKAVVPSNGSVITIPNVVWPAATVNYAAFIGPDIMHMFRYTSEGFPGSITLPNDVSIGFGRGDGPGLPDIAFNKFRILVTPVVHGGVWGLALNSINGNTFQFDGASTTPNQFNGRVISLYGSKSNDSGGFLAQFNDNFTIVADNGSGGFTVSPAPSVVNVGDVFVMRPKGFIASSNTIGDPTFRNPLAPDGMTPGAETGNYVYIIAGTGQGQLKKIGNNTADTLTISDTWDTIPDSTSVFIITAPATVYDQETASFAFDGINGTANQLVASIPLTNLAGSSYLVQVLTADAGGNISPLRYAPFVEVYIYGSPGSVASPGYTVLTVDNSNNAQIDLSTGANFRLALASVQANLLAPIYSGSAVAEGMSFSLYFDQDSNGSLVIPTFAGGVGGFVGNTAAQIQVDPTPLTRTALSFTFHGQYWSLDSQQTGIALT